MLNGLKNPWVVERRIKPHYYQSDAHASNDKAWKEFKRVLNVAPTGSGKTILAGEHIARLVEKRQRSLVLAHTRKLTRQFRKSLEDNYGLSVGLEMGNSQSYEEPVICATFQTMLNRVAKGKFPEDEFALVVIDEAHRSLGDGYTRLAGHFKNSKILGITATPNRSDQKDLLKFFECKAVDIPLFKLIDEGFLCEIKWRNIPIQIALEGKSKSGDFTDEECAHAIEPYLEGALEAFAQESLGRCSMIFLPLIAISKRCVEILTSLGVKAKHVDGTMEEKEVNDIIHELEVGEIDVICNSQLLSEGVDIRPVNCIMLLRPTQSWTFFMQVVGRGTRTYNPAKHGVKHTKWGVKRDMLFLDPLWLCDKHSLIKRPSCLLSSDEEESKAIDSKMKMGMGLKEAQSSVNSDREEKLAEELKRLAKRQARLASAQEIFASTGDLGGFDYEPMARWQRDILSPGQRNLLMAEGVDLTTVKDKGHATILIDSILRRKKDGFATVTQVHEALKLGMVDAAQRSKRDVANWLQSTKQGINPYSDIPEI